MDNNKELKNKVREYWDNETCGTKNTKKEKYTKEFYEEIEKDRYKKEPEILEFADFKSGKDKKVLEIGIGAATDFLQWARNGAKLYGIDLTPEAVKYAEKRLELYNLKAVDIKVSDAENLDFESNFFDIVYSWGVIHHSPNTIQALKEIIRVLKPGGNAKLMIYNSKSLLAYFFWFKHAFLKFKWNLSIEDVIWNHMESIGTKAYSVDQVKEILKKEKDITNIKVGTYITYYDRLKKFNVFFQWIASLVLLFVNKEKAGWFLTIKFTKK